jgi:hypothetical protein
LLGQLSLVPSLTGDRPPSLSPSNSTICICLLRTSALVALRLRFALCIRGITALTSLYGFMRLWSPGSNPLLGVSSTPWMVSSHPRSERRSSLLVLHVYTYFPSSTDQKKAVIGAAERLFLLFIYFATASAAVSVYHRKSITISSHSR